MLTYWSFDEVQIVESSVPSSPWRKEAEEKNLESRCSPSQVWESCWPLEDRSRDRGSCFSHWEATQGPCWVRTQGSARESTFTLSLHSLGFICPLSKTHSRSRQYTFKYHLYMPTTSIFIPTNLHFLLSTSSSQVNVACILESMLNLCIRSNANAQHSRQFLSASRHHCARQHSMIRPKSSIS